MGLMKTDDYMRRGDAVAVMFVTWRREMVDDFSP